MKIKEALKSGYEKLKIKKITSAHLDAEVLLSFAINKSKEFLYTYPEKELSLIQKNKFQNLIRQRSKNIPIAYLINHKFFYGLDFFIDKNVLIPRTETETLIETALKTIAEMKLKSLLDLGTGSGAIAIAIKKQCPKIKAGAGDLSLEALKTAKKNSRVLKADVLIKKGDFKELLRKIPAELIISNPPYIDIKKKKETIKRCPDLKYEPASALFAKNQGLEFYELIIKEIAELKTLPRAIIFEIGDTQAKKISKLTKEYLPRAEIKIIKDLAGKDRVMEIKL